MLWLITAASLAVKKKQKHVVLLLLLLLLLLFSKQSVHAASLSASRAHDLRQERSLF